MLERGEIESEARSSFVSKDARWHRIILCATEAFLTNGYVSTVVDDIAVEARVGKPTIYKLFKDKYGLATVVLRSLSDDLERVCRPSIDMDADPEECLVKLGVTYISWMLASIGKTNHYAVARLLLEMSGPYPQFVELWRDGRKKGIYSPLAKYIGKQIDKGAMVGDDPYFIAAQFIGSVYHAANSVAAESDFNRDLSLTRKKVQLFLRGCTPAADPSSSPKA